MTSNCHVAIVNYNSGPWLRRCVDSALAAGATRITLVDNASSDDSLAGLVADARIEIVRNSHNRGFAVAANQALTSAEADYLLVLNPDCELDGAAIDALCAALAAAPEAAIAGGLVCNQDGTEQRACRRRTPTPWRSLLTMLGLERVGLAGVNVRGALPRSVVEVEAVSGAAVLIRRRCWQQLGGYDERYFLHCEDLDLFYRTLQAGWRILFVPTARVIHGKGVSQRRRPLDAARHKRNGMLRYYGKFFATSVSPALRWFWPAMVRLRYGLQLPVLWWRQRRAQ